MVLVALFIGIVLIVSAVRNSQGALFSALAQDVPHFVVWAAAILLVGAIGFVPGLKPVSRGLLALILLVLFLTNYKGILSGFTNAWQQGAKLSGSTGGGGSTGTDQGSAASRALSSIVQNNFGSADAAGSFASSYGVSGGQ